MSTATRPKPKQETAGDLIQRRLDQAASEESCREQMLNELVRDYDNLEGDQLLLSRGQVLVFESMGLKSIHEIRRALQRHKGILARRERVGDPAVLEQARQEVEKAAEAERTARAELTDIADVEGGAGPVLVRQIQNLETRLAALTAARSTAESRLKSLEQERQHLRDFAPAWLRDQVQRSINATRWNHPAYVALEKMKPQLEAIHHAINEWARQTAVDPETGARLSRFDGKHYAFTGYARHYAPQVLSVKTQYEWAVEERQFSVHVGWLKTEKLPQLLAEQAALQAEWKTVLDELEQPLEKWVRFGHAR